MVPSIDLTGFNVVQAGRDSIKQSNLVDYSFVETCQVLPATPTETSSNICGCDKSTAVHHLVHVLQELLQ